MESTEPAMTPTQAAEVLRDLEVHEQRLDRRTGGLTTMLWGLVSAGIFLTYNAAAAWIEAHEVHWLFSLLWMPWVAAGIGITNALWANLSLSLRREPQTRQGTLVSLLMTGVFLALAAGVFLALDILAGIAWTVNSLMTIVNGLFAAAVAIMVHRLWGFLDASLLVAAGAMVAAGIALGAADVSYGASGLLGALVTGTGWIAAGAATYRRG